MPKPPKDIVMPTKLPPCPKKAEQAGANAGTSWLQGWGDAMNSTLSSSGLSATASNAMNATTDALSELGNAGSSALDNTGDFVSNNTVGLLGKTGSATMNALTKTGSNIANSAINTSATVKNWFASS